MKRVIFFVFRRKHKLWELNYCRHRVSTPLNPSICYTDLVIRIWCLWHISSTNYLCYSMPFDRKTTRKILLMRALQYLMKYKKVFMKIVSRISRSLSLFYWIDNWACRHFRQEFEVLNLIWLFNLTTNFIPFHPKYNSFCLYWHL